MTTWPWGKTESGKPQGHCLNVQFDGFRFFMDYIRKIGGLAPYKRINAAYMAAFLFCMACTTPKEQKPTKLFTLLDSSHTNIEFSNALDYDEEFNVYTYRNFYNGGGVALGDINNDGLLDLYLTGNMQANKLYLNQGNFTFKDITQTANVACKGVWSTGASMVDINGDGLLDIYVCKSGKPEGQNRHNELFINNGDLTFTERAKEYGLADYGLSVHSAFFDYDRDGDLDMYLLNNSIRSIRGYTLKPGQREVRDSLGGNKLYENIGDKFVDVSQKAGIYGSNIGFGLGVSIGDINRDGWPDIFVSNDYFERDYFYVNNTDGTFSEVLEAQMGEISLSSMGADIADINNDGFSEIFVTDMLPEDELRLKTTVNFYDWNRYDAQVKNGYHKQFTRNTLHLNNGDNSFSEIGRLSGVDATDWSWGALMADLDNSGSVDIFVANGIYKDLTDQDYLNFINDDKTIKELISKRENYILKMVDAIPSNKIPNYAFSGEGNLSFTNKAKEWGLDQPSHSNGSAYGDLDNDGDLDLVVNNANMPVFIYRNETDTLDKGSYLSLELTGTSKNKFAIGAQLSLYKDGKVFFKENNPFRGFQSTVDHRVHFGLGDITHIDSLIVLWPNGLVSKQLNVPANQILKIEQTGNLQPNKAAVAKHSKRIFYKNGQLDYKHSENDFVDFNRDRLIYHMVSSEGPKISLSDINGDGLEDIYFGGAKDSEGKVLLQSPEWFKELAQDVFSNHIGAEDLGSVFFDADQDGDMDLYVCSGGNEFSSTSSSLRDRLYLGNGQGGFTISGQLLPTSRYVSSSTVAASDFDGDGDTDLFVGERLKPFLYGVPGSGYLLQNDGKGNFKDVSKELAPELADMGMITNAMWVDIDGDNDDDLVVVGEWMSVKVFSNDKGQFKDVTAETGFEMSHGLWSSLAVGDFNKDGLPDLVLGNHGNNTRLRASQHTPMSMYVNDFDGNGKVEQIVTTYNKEKPYPLVLRHDLLKQISALQKKYPRYQSYKGQTMTDIFTEQQLSKAIELQVRTTSSLVAINQGGGKFMLQELPIEAQFSPIHAILVEDFNGDGNEDLLMGGNFYKAKPEIGIHDASHGLLLLGDGKGGFKPMESTNSGFFVKGEIRDLKKITLHGEKAVIVALNNDHARLFYY